MKKMLAAIILLVGSLACCQLAAAQYSLDDQMSQAFYRHDKAAMQSLLDKGADIEATDKIRRTPLILAACNALYSGKANRINLVKLLLNKGAKLEVIDSLNETPLQCADLKGPVEVVDLLHEAQLERTQLEEAQTKGTNERLAAYVDILQHYPQDDSLREKTVQLAAGLPKLPPFPDDAQQLFVLASGQIKQAATSAALEQRIGLLRKALAMAPWFANAYYNLSRALEMRGQYDDAIKQLRYYLDLKPAEADAREARNHIVAIQAEEDAAAHKQQ